MTIQPPEQRSRPIVPRGRFDYLFGEPGRVDPEPQLIVGPGLFGDRGHALVDEASELAARAGVATPGPVGEYVTGLAHHPNQLGLICSGVCRRFFIVCCPPRPILEHRTRTVHLTSFRGSGHYCCVVLDLFSRRVVGWAIDRRNEATLVNDALTMAASSRVTSPKTILHSDQGSQFTSWSVTQNLKHYKLLGSMGTVGDRFDNAPMESFWGSMQIELLNRKKWMTCVELATAMADNYIVNFYNPLRRHSSREYLTPDECEAVRSDHNPGRTLITVGQ